MKTHRIFPGLLLTIMAMLGLTPVQATAADIQLIDLGLSVEWANMNIDASSPSGTGGYYAWGETSTKSNHSWATYTHCSGSASSCVDIGSDISMNSSYDRAYDYSTKLCLPTAEQWEELISQCIWTETTVSGVKGYNVKGTNGNTIFLPFSGCSYDGSSHGVGSNAYYWTANNTSNDVSKAQAAYIKSGATATITNINRRTGAAIRAVGAPVSIELVDLGLSVKWANINIDAIDAAGQGGYYAWGEIATKDTYSWETYTHCSGTASSCMSIGSDISMNFNHDRAYNYSTKLSLPTAAQWNELITQCTWSETTVEGVKGYTVKGPNGKSIFLPFSGCSYDGSDHGVGSNAYYWSANNVENDASRAQAAYIKSGTTTTVTKINRRTGAAIRAVGAASNSGRQYAIYNYRNDGSFNAWLNMDVDSITYSRIDTLGVVHDDIVVQEVWTPDSLFRIPMEAIDSIGFRAPKPVMQDGLFYLRDYHAAYTLSIDSLTLYFDKSIKNDSLPNVGQVVLASTRNTPYEEGFAGRVVSIENLSSSIRIECEMIAVGDIFKSLVLVGKASSDDGMVSGSRAKVRGSSDPWINIEDDDVIPIQLDEKSFDLFGGLITITSPYPKLTCTYYVYVSEAYFEIYARADLYHRDLSYKLTLTTDQLNTLEEYGQFFKALTSKNGIDEWLNKKFNTSLEKWLKEEAEEEQIANETILKKIWKTKKVDIPIIGNGIINLSLMVAPLFKIKGSLETQTEFKTDAYQSVSIKIKGFTPIPRSGYIDDFDASFSQDPFKSAKLDITAKGTATLGLTTLLNVNLVHRNVLYAGIGGEFGMDVTGILNVTAIDTEQPNMNLYDRLKDTQLKICYFGKVYPEIGVTPIDFFHFSGPKWKLFPDIEDIYYIMPHFTEPELPKFGNSTWLGKNPLSFYSYPSKDIFIPCKIGMRITDLDGKPLIEYANTNRYLDEIDWLNIPLEINVSGLARGASYKCYPTISFFNKDAFNAGPVHNFTIPIPMTASPSQVTMSVDNYSVVEIVGGWDTFAVVISGDDEVASIIHDGTTDARHIKVHGKKMGVSELQIEDRRTGEIVKVPITVTDEDVTQLQLSTTSLTLTSGSQGTVDVTSGSGSYAVKSSNQNVATATRSGSKVTITAVAVGSAVITVKDQQTNQTADIQVTVVDPGTAQTETITVNGVSFKMVAVEGGTFWMGSADDDGDAWSDERPRHQVTLSSFSIGQTEVTQELWEAVMGENPSSFKGANRPVEYVSWDDCQTFISKLNAMTGKNFRLPTEAEWEYAARGGKQSHGYKYAGSNDIDAVAWYENNAYYVSDRGTRPVAQKQANELGLYDMSGNVWEWCQDWYSGSYYSNSPSTNPCNTTEASDRVFRGGCWDYRARGCRVAFRNFNAPGYRDYDLGLRLAR